MARAGAQWMPLHIADYDADTGHLSVEEHGAYFQLLKQAWQRGGALPIDDERLRGMSKMNAQQWKRSRATLLAFFTRIGDELRQKRLDVEIKLMEHNREQRAIAGRTSAENRKRNKTGGEGPTGGQHPFNGCSTDVGTDEPTERPTKGSTKDQTSDQRDVQQNGNPLPLPSSSLRSEELVSLRSTNARDARSRPSLPDWMPVEAWNGYLEMRRRQKKPPTPHAVELLIGKLEKFRTAGHDPVAVLDQSTVGGWTDLYAPKTATNGAKPTPASSADWMLERRMQRGFNG